MYTIQVLAIALLFNLKFFFRCKYQRLFFPTICPSVRQPPVIAFVKISVDNMQLKKFMNQFKVVFPTKPFVQWTASNCPSVVTCVQMSTVCVLDLSKSHCVFSKGVLFPPNRPSARPSVVITCVKVSDLSRIYPWINVVFAIVIVRQTSNALQILTGNS